MALYARHIPRESIDEATTKAYSQIRTRFGFSIDKGPAGDILTRFYGLRNLILPFYEEVLKDPEFPLETMLAADAYATAIAAKETLKGRLEKVPLNGYVVSFPTRGDASLRERLLLNKLFERHLRISRERPAMAIASAEQLVKSLYIESEHLLKELPQKVRSYAERSPVMVDETMYQGLSEESGTPVVKTYHPKKEVVGNKEAISGLRRNLYRIGHFNPETMSNPFVEIGLTPAQTALLSGPTGTGKTLLTNVVYEEFIEWAARHGLAPVKEHALGNELKTSLINDGSNNVRAKFNQMLIEPVIHIGIVDEFDSVVFARSNLTNHEEEYKFQSEYMIGLSRLEAIKERGNIFLTHITNFPEKLDPAMRARVSELAFAVYGPTTPEERGQLLANELRSSIDMGLVTVGDWTALGRIAGEHISQCSGRDLKNLALKVNQMIDEEFYDGRDSFLPPAPSVEHLKSMVKERTRPVDEDTIEKLIKEYALLLENERQRVKLENINERKRELELELEARRELERKI